MQKNMGNNKAGYQNKSKKTNSIQAIISHNVVFNDPVVMADKFNEFFTYVAHEIVEKIHPTDQELYLENTQSQSTLPDTNFKFNFIDNPLTLQEVNDAILKLKLHWTMTQYPQNFSK